MMNKIAGNVSVVGVLHIFSFDYIKHCDYVISVSNHMKNKLTVLGFPKEKIFYLPNMIKILNGSQHVKPVLYHIPIIGMITRIEKTKGVDIFINALSILKLKNIPFLAIIAGNGSDYKEIQNLIKQLGLKDNIQMDGWLQIKQNFMRKSIYYAYPHANNLLE